MACETRLREGQTFAQRVDQVKEALARLERYLATGSVKVTIAPNGALAFNGWKDRDDITDACAYRTLSFQNSWTLKQAVLKAEQMSGRKVNPAAVAAGHHSHDGGRTWQKH